MGIGEVFKVSARRLKDNYKNEILTFLAFSVINIGLGVVLALLSLLFGGISVIRFFIPVIYLAFSIIELPLANAYLKQVIKASSGEDISAFGFTQDVKGLFLVSWKVAFYTFLKYLTPICIGLVSLILIATNISLLELIGRYWIYCYWSYRCKLVFVNWNSNCYRNLVICDFINHKEILIHETYCKIKERFC